jgi:hypothetical protein
MTYQAPEVLEVGRAQEVIEGGPPFSSEPPGIPLTSAAVSVDFEE